jgi:hypothetical protein
MRVAARLTGNFQLRSAIGFLLLPLPKPLYSLRLVVFHSHPPPNHAIAWNATQDTMAASANTARSLSRLLTITYVGSDLLSDRH